MAYDRNTGGGTTADGQLDALTDLVAAALDGTETRSLAAALEGRAYLGPTGMQDVANGEALYAMISNPANSGRRIWLSERWFDNNRATGTVPLEYTAYPAPTLTLANTGTINRLGVNKTDSAGNFTWQVGAGLLLGGPEASGGALPTGGERFVLTLDEFAIEPGAAVAFRIDAGDQVLQAEARAAITFKWYEEVL